MTIMIEQWEQYNPRYIYSSMNLSDLWCIFCIIILQCNLMVFIMVIIMVSTAGHDRWTQLDNFFFLMKVMSTPG